MNDNGPKILAAACEFVMRCAEGKLHFVGFDTSAIAAVAKCNEGRGDESDFELLSHFAIFDESVAIEVASMTSPNLLIA